MKNIKFRFFDFSRGWAKRTVALSTITAAILLSAQNCKAFEIKQNEVYPKIITPNGDGRNDRFFVKFRNPFDNEIQSKIYDLRGCEIAVMELSASEDFFFWDGKDSTGNPAPPGAYIFQVTGEGTVYKGVIIVAR